MQGWGWTAVHHPDHVQRVVDRIQLSWDSGTPWEDSFPLRGVDGEYRWFLSRALPIRDDDGKVRLWFGTNTDITEQRAHEQKIEFLLGEVNHRSKNLLAMVQGLVRRTMTEKDAEFLAGFDRRMVAIGANLDLLTKRKWVGATVRDVIVSQLSYFHDLLGSRIVLEGDEALMMSPSAAEAIGLAIHELATNAGKYGALSTPTGRLRIEWRVIIDRGSRFELRWTEHGGPVVVPPTRAGFGTTVVTRNPRAVLGADVRLDYAPEGLVWEIDAPLANVEPPLGT